MTKQTLSDEDRKEVVLYRLEKAERTYNEAVDIVQKKYTEIVANRLYYAAYYAVTAYLIANGVSVRTHSGVRSMFGLYLIKTKLLDTKFSPVFNTLFSLRMTGDYEDRRNLDMETDVLPLVKPAKELIDKVSQLTREKLTNN